MSFAVLRRVVPSGKGRSTSRRASGAGKASQIEAGLWMRIILHQHAFRRTLANAYRPFNPEHVGIIDGGVAAGDLDMLPRSLPAARTP